MRTITLITIIIALSSVLFLICCNGKGNSDNNFDEAAAIDSCVFEASDSDMLIDIAVCDSDAFVNIPERTE